MNDFKPFDDKLAGLIAALSPTARRKMAADIAKMLRARQQRRIKTQKAPDGTPYAARKRQPVNAKKGRVKREMFAKLRTSRFMKAFVIRDSAVVEFTKTVQHITQIHHYGLRDRPSIHSDDMQYPMRQLLGIGEVDKVYIEQLIMERLILS